MFDELNLKETMLAIRRDLEKLANRLTAEGFRFDYPEEVLVAPDPRLASSMAKIESEVGAISLAVRSFWEIVGSVNFCGSHPLWEGETLPDPIVVFPIEYALEELADFLADREDYLGTGVFRIPIAPDSYHKAGMSGGMGYGIEVPNSDHDPVLLEEKHGISFTEHLRVAITGGGFPGLEGEQEANNWPISKIVEGLEISGRHV